MVIKKLFFALAELERIALVGATATLLLSASIMLGLFVQQNTRLAPAEGGEYREGIIGQPVFINPIIPTTNADREVSRIVFGSLADIVESVKHSDDGKVWNVRLKQNVLWHDGEPVTADDVVFTVNTIQDREARSPLFASFQGIAAERVSELEVKFTLQSPYAFFAEEHLKDLSIIPKHLFGDLPVQNFKLSIYGLKPIGFGPYKVDSYEKDARGMINSFSLSANEKYIAGRPFISNFVFKFFKDENSLISAYNANAIDGFLLGTSQKIAGASKAESDAVKIRHTTYAVKSSRYYSVFINNALDANLFGDRTLREALSRSIDREAIIKQVFGSYAAPLYGPTLFTPEPTDTFDASKLKDAKLNITVPDEDFLVKTAGILKDSWTKAGAEVNVTALPAKTIEDKILKETDYELLLLGNTLSRSGDLFSFWHSSRRFYPDQNLALYQNKKLDGLLEQFRKNFDDKSRDEKLKQISQLIADDYPAVFIYSPDYIYIATPALHGFDASQTMAIPSDRFSNIREWYLKTKRSF